MATSMETSNRRALVCCRRHGGCFLFRLNRIVVDSKSVIRSCFLVWDMGRSLNNLNRDGSTLGDYYFRLMFVVLFLVWFWFELAMLLC